MNSIRCFLSFAMSVTVQNESMYDVCPGNQSKGMDHFTFIDG